MIKVMEAMIKVMKAVSSGVETDIHVYAGWPVYNPPLPVYNIQPCPPIVKQLNSFHSRPFRITLEPNMWPFLFSFFCTLGPPCHIILSMV